MRAAERHLAAGLIAATAIAMAAPAFAQGNTTPPRLPHVREEIVVTASVTPAAAEGIGRGVSVVLRDDALRLGVTSVIEALRLVPSIDVRARGPRDVQTDFSIRGATFGQSLVLVDGIRLNDSQSGHHNGEIPVPLVGMDRIEVVPGPGSAVHGADALAGAINVVTRTDAHAVTDLSAGQHGLFAAQASISGHGLPDRWTVTGWGARSSGFAFDRDFAQGGAGVRAAIVDGVVVSARHQRRAFGADGFYGNSPSKEWTDQTVGAATWSASAGAWTSEVRGAYRNHGDHFRWDINRPGFAENRHRTDAVEATGIVRRQFASGRRIAFGGGSGGDWIESSGLGDHRYLRASTFGEIQAPMGDRVTAQAAVRFDTYSTFGSAWTPMLATTIRVNDTLRARASAARAFRVPTFTELYYRDPGHSARANLEPEDGWSLDGGLDWTRGAWTASVSPFIRWDANVIDWVRAQPADVWQTTNVRDVETRGLELSMARSWRSAMVRGHYAALDVEAPRLDLLSKYVLEYARHSIGAALTTPLVHRARLALRVDHRRRVGGDAAWLVGARLSHPLGRAEIYVDGANLLNESYVEVPGVAMPGRWITAGVWLR